jgi:hypothetical protein
MLSGPNYSDVDQTTRVRPRRKEDAVGVHTAQSIDEDE